MRLLLTLVVKKMCLPLLPNSNVKEYIPGNLYIQSCHTIMLMLVEVYSYKKNNKLRSFLYISDLALLVPDIAIYILCLHQDV